MKKKYGENLNRMALIVYSLVKDLKHRDTVYRAVEIFLSNFILVLLIRLWRPHSVTSFLIVE